MSRPPFRHRVSGELSSRLPEPAVPGLWRIDLEGAALNRARLAPGDALVGDGHGDWSLCGAEHRLAGRVHRELAPEAGEAENLRVLGESLAVLEAKGATHDAWLGVPPLVPGVHEKMKPLPWEGQLRTRLEHLRIVCRRPRTHLHGEVDRVPVSRARRMPGGAFAYLAAHPEDWERRTLSGVRPRRVLSVLTGETVDTYENRLTADLVDRLRVRLRARIRELRALVDLLAYSLDFGQSGQGTRWRRDRTYRRWGHMTIREADWDAGRRTLLLLQGMEGELRALLDSPLYRGLPGGPRTSGALRRTNVLARDQHYRHVADLWLILGEAGRRPPRSPEERHGEAQEAIRHFARFSWLLVIHALAACGFEFLEEDAGSLRVRAPWADVYQVHRDSDGSVRLLDAAGDSLLRLVPLHAALAQAGEGQRAGVRAQVENAGREPAHGAEKHPTFPCPAVVLFPGSARDLAALPGSDAAALYRFAAGMPASGPGLLPVSTQDIDSVERVGRAIRWATHRGAMLAYPPRVRVPPTLRSIVPGAGFDLDGNVLTIRKPVVPPEMGRLTRAVEAVRRTALSRGRQGEAEVSGIEQFREAFDAADGVLSGLACCPLCGKEAARIQFTPRSGDTFAARCPACETGWGIDLCAACGERIPYLLPLLVNGGPATRGTGWADQAFGADLLALPAEADSSQRRFRCPACTD